MQVVSAHRVLVTSGLGSVMRAANQWTWYSGSHLGQYDEE